VSSPVASEAPLAELDPPITDWLLRPFAAVSFSPLWLGALAVVAYTLVSQAGRIFLGTSAWELNWVLVDGLNGVIVAFTATGLFYLRGFMLRDLSELQPVLGCSRAELEEIAIEVTCVPARRLLAFVVPSVLVFFAMPILDPQFFGNQKPPPLGDPELTFYMLRSALTGWVVGHAAATELQSTRAYHGLAARDLDIDLLDTSPLHTFTRRGQRACLVWIGAASLVSLFWLSEVAGSTNGIIMVAIIFLIVGSFFYSIRGVHGSIVREKQSQLDQLRSEIRRERGSLLDRDRDDGGSARLASLLAYHDLVERAPEWPFDTPVVLRLALFVLLGLGSWLGGALVERLLESLI
jgi:hypothetical protein